jgi:hypothetical protein
MNDVNKRFKILQCLNKRILKLCDQAIKATDLIVKNALVVDLIRLHKRFLSVVNGE